jgi:hypothetical protein
MEAVKRILLYLLDIYGLGVSYWRQSVGWIWRLLRGYCYTC